MIEPDGPLLERARRGGEGAFDALFLRYCEQVYMVLFRLCGSREEAEDLAQDTFLELYRNPPFAHSDTPLVSWLCRVALNKGYNALRGERRASDRIARLDTPAYSGEDPAAELVRAEEQSEVRDALAQLPERQSRLLLLRYTGLSYEEVAAALDVAPGSVGALLARAERAFVAAYKAAEERAGSLERTKP